MDNFRKILESISHRHDTRRVFEGFTKLAAYALAAQTRETEYLEEAKCWTRDELMLFSQALGALVSKMESRLAKVGSAAITWTSRCPAKAQQWNGEFHMEFLG